MAALWVTVVIGLAVPAIVIGVPIAHEMINAGKGASTPREALVRWVYTFEDATRSGELMAERLIVASQRDKLTKQRRDYIATRTTDTERHPEAVPGRFELADPPPNTEPARQTITGNSATVVMYWRVTWTAVNDPSGLRSKGTSLPWRAELRQERDGWRLFSVAIAPWCAANSNDASTPAYSLC